MMNYSSDTRIGFAEDIWMIGVIDEVRMPLSKNDHNPILIDTKTRARDTLPAEPQRRNGRYAYSFSIYLILLMWNCMPMCMIESLRRSSFWQASIDVLQVHVGQFSF
jgi:hypothetical protein